MKNLKMKHVLEKLKIANFCAFFCGFFTKKIFIFLDLWVKVKKFKESEKKGPVLENNFVLFLSDAIFHKIPATGARILFSRRQGYGIYLEKKSCKIKKF